MASEDIYPEDEKYRLLELFKQRPQITREELSRAILRRPPSWNFRPSPLALSNSTGDMDENTTNVVANLGESAQPLLKYLTKKDLENVYNTNRELREKVIQLRKRIRTRLGPLEVIPIGPIRNIYKEFRLLNTPLTRFPTGVGYTFIHLAAYNDDVMIFSIEKRSLTGNAYPGGFYTVRRFPDSQNPYKYRNPEEDPPLPPLVKEGDDGYTIMSHLVSPRSLLDFLDPNDLDALRHTNKEFRDVVTTYAQRRDVNQDRPDLRDYKERRSGIGFYNYNHDQRGYTKEVRNNLVETYREDIAAPRIPKLFRVPTFHEGPTMLRFASNDKGDFYGATRTAIFYMGRANNYVAQMIAGDSIGGNADGPATQARWMNITGISYCSRGLAILSTVPTNNINNSNSRISFLDFSMSRLGVVRTLHIWNADRDRLLSDIAATNDAVYAVNVVIDVITQGEGIYAMQITDDVTPTTFPAAIGMPYTLQLTPNANFRRIFSPQQTDMITCITSRNNDVFVTKNVYGNRNNYESYLCKLQSDNSLQVLAKFPIGISPYDPNVKPFSICAGANGAIYGLKNVNVNQTATIFKFE